jgi:hypothetical protein
VQWVNDAGIEESVAHIASDGEQFSRRTFCTASTFTMTGPRRRAKPAGTGPVHGLDRRHSYVPRDRRVT